LFDAVIQHHTLQRMSKADDGASTGEVDRVPRPRRKRQGTGRQKVHSVLQDVDLGIDSGKKPADPPQGTSTRVLRSSTTKAQRPSKARAKVAPRPSVPRATSTTASSSSKGLGNKVPDQRKKIVGKRTGFAPRESLAADEYGMDDPNAFFDTETTSAPPNKTATEEKASTRNTTAAARRRRERQTKIRAETKAQAQRPQRRVRTRAVNLRRDEPSPRGAAVAAADARRANAATPRMSLSPLLPPKQAAVKGNRVVGKRTGFAPDENLPSDQHGMDDPDAFFATPKSKPVTTQPVTPESDIDFELQETPVALNAKQKRIQRVDIGEASSVQKFNPVEDSEEDDQARAQQSQGASQKAGDFGFESTDPLGSQQEDQDENFGQDVSAPGSPESGAGFLQGASDTPGTITRREEGLEDSPVVSRQRANSTTSSNGLLSESGGADRSIDWDARDQNSDESSDGEYEHEALALDALNQAELARIEDLDDDSIHSSDFSVTSSSDNEDEAIEKLLEEGSDEEYDNIFVDEEESDYDDQSESDYDDRDGNDVVRRVSRDRYDIKPYKPLPESKRPQRKRFAALNHWQGERILYESRVFNGVRMDDAIQAGKPDMMVTPEPVRLRTSSKRQVMTQGEGAIKKRAKASDAVPPLRMPRNVHFDDPASPIHIKDQVSGKEEEHIVVRSHNDIVYTSLQKDTEAMFETESGVLVNAAASEAGAAFHDSQFVSGHVLVPPFASTPRENVDLTTQIYIVVEAQERALVLTMAGKVYRLSKSDQFWVPPQTNYSLQNFSSKVTAKLAYVLIKPAQEHAASVGTPESGRVFNSPFVAS